MGKYFKNCFVCHVLTLCIPSSPALKDKAATAQFCLLGSRLSSPVLRSSRRSPGPPPVSVLHAQPQQNIASMLDRPQGVTLSAGLSLFLSAFQTYAPDVGFKSSSVLLLSNYQKAKQWWQYFGSSSLAFKQKKFLTYQQGCSSDNTSQSKPTSAYMFLLQRQKAHFYGIRWKLSYGN